MLTLFGRQPRAQMTVEFEDQTQAPVRYGSVQVLARDGSVILEQVVDGRTSLLLPRGEYTLVALSPGFLSASRHVKVGTSDRLREQFMLIVAGACSGSCGVSVETPKVDLEPSPLQHGLLEALPTRGGDCPIAGRWLRRSWRR